MVDDYEYNGFNGNMLKNYKDVIWLYLKLDDNAPNYHAMNLKSGYIIINHEYVI